jgi:carotenoid 1,2-hydratase
VGEEGFLLDEAGRHRWTPLRLNARATVRFDNPHRTEWSGPAYVDTNDGDEPLERGFRSWDWSRTSGSDLTHVVYDVTRADGSMSSVRRTFRQDGTHVPLSGVEAFEVGKTRWGVRRRVPSDVGTPPRVSRSLEDTPFYARTLSTARVAGQPVHLVHETVDLQRFDRRWVQFLIPFRMRRVA